MNVALEMKVNGATRRVSVPAQSSLLTVLREQFGLTGSKRGCGEGECGACSVLLDGRLVTACLIFAAEAAGRDIVTVEGLGDAHHLSPVQQAFAEAGASQCGFCMPGMLMATTALLEEHPDPDEAHIRQGISGNLCRCTGYDLIVQGIQKAARSLRA